MRKSRARGFLLVEFLAIFAIIGTVIGVAALTSQDSTENERRRVYFEAQNLSSWLENRMALAAREDAEFRLFMSQDTDRSYSITAVWYDGIKYLEHEQYSPEEATMSYEGSYELVFSGRWFTLTPAATFILKSKKNSDIMYFVTVSATGYVDIKDET